MSTHCSCTDGCEPSCGCWELNLGPLLLLQSTPFAPAQRFTYYYTYVHLSVAVFRHTKRGHGCEPPCACWDLNSGPLEEQSCSYSLSFLTSLILFLFYVCGHFVLMYVYALCPCNAIPMEAGRGSSGTGVRDSCCRGCTSD